MDSPETDADETAAEEEERPTPFHFFAGEPDEQTETDDISQPESETPSPEKKKGPATEQEGIIKSLFKSSSGRIGLNSDQELLDSALEFVQASYDFWERGELENALDALDQAYSIILKVKPDDNPKILQQREDLRFTISKRIIEVYSSRFSAANGNHTAIPLEMNVHVEKALEQFKGRERKFFLESYRRSGRYRPFIIKSLRKAGLPEDLSWLPLIESGYKLRALSRSRALGLWQFIASTGYKYGLKRDRWVDERMDPEKATAAAIDYLKELHHIFGDWTTALAAYNCGEGNVLRRISTQKINYLDNFWDLYGKLPLETAFYVPRFLAILHIVKNPEAHGFALPPVDNPVETVKVTISKQAHLKEISGELGLDFHTLRDMNPELRYDATPNRAYTLKVPKGKKELFLARVNSIPMWKPPAVTYVRHRVRRGETLSTIARKYRTSVRAIMAMNGLRSKRYIKVGWKLKIPSGRPYVSPPSAPTVSTSPGTHTIRRGETLSSIAKMYGTTTGAIMTANGLNSERYIKSGWVLKIPTLKGGAQPEKAPTVAGGQGTSEDSVKYTVRKGDSLWKLAERFGTTTEAIKALNKLKTGDLNVGQTIMIPSGSDDLKAMATNKYTVRKGDSPFSIAMKHQMDLSELLMLNRLTPRSKIFPGQVLLVKAQ